QWLAARHLQLDSHFFQQTLDLVLQAYSVAGELQLHAGHAPPDTLFAVGHKTQNQFVGDQSAHQPLGILEVMFTPTGSTVGKRLRQVQTQVGFQFHPHRPPVLGSRLHDRLFHSCSRNHVKRRCNSLGMVTNRCRAGFSSGILASTTTTINTFLCTSIPPSSSLPPKPGSGRTHAKKVTHRHVLPPLLPAEVARHRLVQNARSRSNSKTASLHPECKQTFAVHAPSAYTHNSTHFHVNKWAPWALEPLNRRKCSALTDNVNEGSTTRPERKHSLSRNETGCISWRIMKRNVCFVLTLCSLLSFANYIHTQDNAQQIPPAVISDPPPDPVHPP